MARRAAVAARAAGTIVDRSSLIGCCPVVTMPGSGTEFAAAKRVSLSASNVRLVLVELGDDQA